MFRSLRKLSSILISMFILVTLFSSTIVYGKGLIIEYDEPEVGIVIDVIDGEAIKVMHINSSASKPMIEYIRLIGVDSMANDDTYEYMKDQLLGQPVFILYDDNVLPITDEYVNAYVFVNTDQTMNENLLTYGYAILDESFNNAMYYNDLVNAEQIAIRQEKGLHKLSTTPSNIININLASTSLIQEHFGVSSIVSNSIISYRLKNPINSSIELGFIHDDITREFIMNNRASIHYTSNINTATQYELTSLFSNTGGISAVSEIVNDRIFTPYTNIEELKEITSISSYYSIIEPFVTTNINDNLFISNDLQVANVNTAYASELIEATGMSSYFAKKIIDQRDKTGYIYRGLEELRKPNFPLANMIITPYIDNLTFSTEINTADDFELKTLFSNLKLSESQQETMVNRMKYKRPFYNYEDLSAALGSIFYDELKAVIYIDGIEKNELTPININSVTKEEIVNYLDLDGLNKTSVLSKTNDYSDPYSLTFLDVDNMGDITLFTNINNASYNELMNLNKKMTKSIVTSIIDYRSSYPIYSLDELEELFIDLNKYSVFELIKNEVVFY